MVDKQLQSLAVDDFFYFFLRLRKERIRKVVQTMRERFPQETKEQLARRIIASHSQLSLVGGSLLFLPTLLPGIGQFLKLMGVVMGASALTRMHLYLILEIALIYDKDIDDKARVVEMIAVVAATGAAIAAPQVVDALKLDALFSIPIAGLTGPLVTQLIGNAAIQYYGKPALIASDSAQAIEASA